MGKYSRLFRFGRILTAWCSCTSIAKLAEDLTLAEMELRDAQAEEIEIEAVLDYAEMIILNASNLWKAAPAEQKQRLQQVSIP
jgi:hypothetical protein